ncbi:triose-phosphate isomerase family protein [Actinoplanes sp. NPDC051851]|uniref:triose-phosphate isomerase family protein n=1 Tax=Actinoplanes sp. NPDC051851 TaxID=3154753 RepID=UPI003412F872
MTTTVGVSLKMYFGHRRARDWFAEVAERAGGHPAVVSGAVELFVVPTYLQVLPAVAAFAGTRVRIGAQDVAGYETGAYTGEVSAAELAEVGVSLAEIGHAERRRLFGETDRDTAAKATEALRHGVTPLLCADSADQLRAGLTGVPAGPVIAAYEPVWAIGAAEPASAGHIGEVASAMRDVLADRPGSRVIYGGSAGPGLLTALGTTVDGVFLGRFAHDPAALVEVLDEAAS